MSTTTSVSTTKSIKNPERKFKLLCFLSSGKKNTFFAPCSSPPNLLIAVCLSQKNQNTFSSFCSDLITTSLLSQSSQSSILSKNENKNALDHFKSRFLVVFFAFSGSFFKISRDSLTPEVCFGEYTSVLTNPIHCSASSANSASFHELVGDS